MNIVSVNRINLLGASGAGTSTIGRALAERLSIRHLESDDYYHAPSDPPFQNPRDPGERRDLLVADSREQESWVLSGGVAGWEPYPELNFTLMVFVQTPREIRMQRLRAREQERFGDRILPGGDMHATHQEFIDWASRYEAGDVEGKTLPRHLEYLNEQKCQVIKVDGNQDLQILVDTVLNEIEFADS